MDKTVSPEAWFFPLLLFLLHGVSISLKSPPCCPSCGPHCLTCPIQRWRGALLLWYPPECWESVILTGSSWVMCLSLHPARLQRETWASALEQCHCRPAPMAEKRGKMTFKGHLGSCSQKKGAVSVGGQQQMDITLKIVPPHSALDKIINMALNGGCL